MKMIILLFIIHRVCNVESLLSNLTSDHSELPEIKEGDTCVAGKLYKMSCNTCRCGENDALICTKMACLDVAFMKELKNKVKHDLRQDGGSGHCVPGTIYRDGCHLCFCNDLKISVCSKEPCTEKLSSKLKVDLKYLWSAFNEAAVDRLPTLPHLATRCVTGKSYKIDCNICVCRENGNLLCTQDLCPTPEGLAKVEAYRNSGKPCTKQFTIPSKCVQCNCTDGKTKCSAIMDCKDMHLLMSNNTEKNKKLRLDLDKGGCSPMMIYSVHCNKCYCQEDRSLRCTQKTCLTYTETATLQKQRRYLERHGL